VSTERPLTENMRRHLRELLAAPYWGPETPGEWQTARALERRGYLHRTADRGKRPYSLTEAGRQAAMKL
jgi:hypothetical protein